MARGFDKGVQARWRGAREIAFRAGKLDGGEFIPEAAEFGEACGDFELFGGGCRSEDGNF
jgi:hypothetical protein